MTRLALVVASVVLPGTLVTVAVLLRVECKDGEVTHLAIGRLHSEIWNSRLFGAVRAVVTLAASPPLLRGVEVKSLAASSTVNHRCHRSLLTPVM